MDRTTHAPPSHLPRNAHAIKPRFHARGSRCAANARYVNAPVILSRFGRYVVPTLLTLTFRKNWCYFHLGATLCHDVLRCCHAIATPEPRYCPALTRWTSDTGKFSCVVLRYVSLPPRCSLAVATLSYAVPRIWRSIACHNVSETWHNGECISRTFLHVSATPQSRFTTPCYAIVTLAIRCCYVIDVAENVPEFRTCSKFRCVKNPVYVLPRLITFGPRCLTLQLRRGHVVPRFAT